MYQYEDSLALLYHRFRVAAIDGMWCNTDSYPTSADASADRHQGAVGREHSGATNGDKTAIAFGNPDSADSHDGTHRCSGHRGCQ